jgi:hypothetical protein
VSPDFVSVNFVDEVEDPLPQAPNANAITDVLAAVAFLLFFSSVSLTSVAKTVFPFTTRDAIGFIGNILTLYIYFGNEKNWARLMPSPK